MFHHKQFHNYRHQYLHNKRHIFDFDTGYHLVHRINQHFDNVLMINSYNYSIDKTGITESNLEINLISNLNRVNVNSFIKRYKVSNFFKGKYFLKRLIKKIF